MGNPAGDQRKLKEKRRKRQEQRLGPGAYLPKEEREQLQAALARAAETEKVAKAKRVERSKARTAEQAAAKAKPAGEKPAGGEKPAKGKPAGAEPAKS